MIEAKIILDSVAPSGIRLTTFVLTYPRFIHSELLTHRQFSRNASSSRAIPVKKQIQMVIDNPAIPLVFRKNQKGMQAGEPVENQELARSLWLGARDEAVRFAHSMADLDVHKQYANRILEPWAHISVIVTATDFDNFFALRYHEMAQPEFCELARVMYELYRDGNPTPLQDGAMHLPFVGWFEIQRRIDKGEFLSINELLKISVARCARVSFLNHEGKESTLDEDTKLYDRLLSANPIHASPAEHQATAMSDSEFRSGNFRGWQQFRKTLPNECVTKFKKEKK